MCCNGASRICLLIVGAWTILQCIVFIIMSTLGMKAYKCELSMNDGYFQYLFHIIYFRGETCESIDLKYLNISVPAEAPKLIVPDVTEVTKRMQRIVLAYFILSIIWMVSTVALIIGSCIPNLNKIIHHILFKSWIFICFTTLIMDLVATVYFIFDITKTQTFEDLLDILEVENKDLLLSVITDPPTFVYSIPAIILALISSRFGLFLIVNASIICCVQAASSNLIKNISKKNKAPTVRQPDFGYETNNGQQSNGLHPSASSQMRYTDQAQSQYQYDNPNYNDGAFDYSLPRLGRQDDERPKNDRMPNDRMPNDRMQNDRPYNDRIQNDRPYNDRMKNDRPYNDRMHNDRQNIDNQNNDRMPPNRFSYDRTQNDRRMGDHNNRQNNQNNATNRNNENNENNLRRTTSQASSIERDSGLITHNNRQNNQNNAINRNNENNENNLRRTTSQGSSIERDSGLITPPIRQYGHPNGNGNKEEKRNSIEPIQKPDRSNVMKPLVENVIKEEDHARTSVVPPEELRSQLPWSYTQGISLPKRAFVVVKEKEELPPVPVPDYTLHFPKGIRPTIQNETNESM